MNNYENRINRVIDYIDQHIGDDLDLEILAGIASFSKFHFYRIFFACTGETIGTFITRLRLQRAALILKSVPEKRVLDIAIECGFSGASTFARSFKNQYGVSALEWRKKSNISKYDSNESEAEKQPKIYFSFEGTKPKWRISMEEKEINVEIREIDKKHLAYVRHTGSYSEDAVQIQECWTRLLSWAGVNGLINPGEMVIAIYHDDPEVVDAPDQRTSICITVPANTTIPENIGLMELNGGTYGVGSFTLKPNEYKDAWNWMYGFWLPKSGFEPDERICFENYPSPPNNDGSCNVEIWVPIKRS